MLRRFSIQISSRVDVFCVDHDWSSVCRWNENKFCSVVHADKSQSLGMPQSLNIFKSQRKVFVLIFKKAQIWTQCMYLCLCFYFEGSTFIATRCHTRAPASQSKTNRCIRSKTQIQIFCLLTHYPLKTKLLQQPVMCNV